MKSYTDKVVSCPYDKLHKMPSQRLSWHLPKCPTRIARAKLNLPTYHCKHYYAHIYLDKMELDMHEKFCESNPARKDFIKAEGLCDI